MTLNEILQFPSNSNTSSYEDQAKELMLNYCIKKQVDADTVYRYYINEIELYYYNKSNLDTSVYPHFFKNAGQFRIHFSGVDITFVSNWDEKEQEARERLKKGKNMRSDINPTLDFKQLKDIIEGNNISYGGILLRTIQPFHENPNMTRDTELPIVGPLCVMNELFYLDGQDLSLTLEKCPFRDKLEIKVRKRIGLGKNAGKSVDTPNAEDHSSDLKNYSLKAI